MSRERLHHHGIVFRKNSRRLKENNIIAVFVITFKTILLSHVDGKSALAVGAGCFNKLASKAYSALSKKKEELAEKCAEEDQTLSRREIKKTGKKIFQKIEKQVGIIYYVIKLKL